VIKKVDDECYEVLTDTRSPSIYLDHWALRHFSSNAEHRTRFLSFFNQRGTLLFSQANTLDILGNTGKSLEEIRQFLHSIGEQWFPIEFNPIKVIEREKLPPLRKNSPCFAQSFFEHYIPYIYDGPLNLVTLVDLISDKEMRDGLSESLESMKRSLIAHLNGAREYWRSKGRMPSDISFHPHYAATFVYNRLLSFVIKDDFKIDGNHVLDLSHAAVSLAYADFVLLDKHWANLAGRLGLPADSVRVYSQPQIDQFLVALDNWQSPQAAGEAS
jgi:hypothetical protein